MQEVESKIYPEIGYHMRMEFYRNGYASEAAKACLEYAFTILKMDRVCSYMKKDNIPSKKVAEKIGMISPKEFRKVVFGEIVYEVLCIKEGGAA